MTTKQSEGVSVVAQPIDLQRVLTSLLLEGFIEAVQESEEGEQ
jgi:hypothetical protein